MDFYDFLLAGLIVGALIGFRVCRKQKAELDWHRREPIRKQQQAMELDGIEGLRGELGVARVGRTFSSASVSKSQKAAKEFCSRLESCPARQIGVVRGKENAECILTTAIGSKFLFDKHGELVWSRPKGKELSIWSQC